MSRRRWDGQGKGFNKLPRFGPAGCVMALFGPAMLGMARSGWDRHGKARKTSFRG